MKWILPKFQEIKSQTRLDFAARSRKQLLVKKSRPVVGRRMRLATFVKFVRARIRYATRGHQGHWGHLPYHGFLWSFPLSWEWYLHNRMFSISKKFRQEFLTFFLNWPQNIIKIDVFVEFLNILVALIMQINYS